MNAYDPQKESDQTKRVSRQEERGIRESRPLLERMMERFPPDDEDLSLEDLDREFPLIEDPILRSKIRRVKLQQRPASSSDADETREETEFHLPTVKIKKELWLLPLFLTLLLAINLLLISPLFLRAPLISEPLDKDRIQGLIIQQNEATRAQNGQGLAGFLEELSVRPYFLKENSARKIHLSESLHFDETTSFPDNLGASSLFEVESTNPLSELTLQERFYFYNGEDLITYQVRDVFSSDSRPIPLRDDENSLLKLRVQDNGLVIKTISAERVLTPKHVKDFYLKGAIDPILLWRVRLIAAIPLIFLLLSLLLLIKALLVKRKY